MCRLLCRLLVPPLLLAAAAVLAAANAPFAHAHGNPEITIHPNPVPTGSSVLIKGQGFEEGVEVSLNLEGVSGTIALGMAMTDAEGRFEEEVDLPGSATPGSYRLRAEGSDDSAVLEFRISAGGGGAPLSAGHETSVGFHRGGPAREVIGLAAAAAVLAVAGTALLLVRESPGPGKGRVGVGGPRAGGL